MDFDILYSGRYMDYDGLRYHIILHTWTLMDSIRYILIYTWTSIYNTFCSTNGLRYITLYPVHGPLWTLLHYIMLHTLTTMDFVVLYYVPYIDYDGLRYIILCPLHGHAWTLILYYAHYMGSHGLRYNILCSMHVLR